MQQFNNLPVLKGQFLLSAHGSTSQPFGTNGVHHRLCKADQLIAALCGHGITYTGASGLENQTRTSCTIKRCLSQLNESLSIEDELRLLKQELLAIAGKRNVVLIGAAISNGNRIVLSTSLVSEAITELTNENGNCLAFSGESEILIKLTDMFPVERNAFPLQESINYLRFLTRSVAGVQHYAQINQTVSEECDILVIQDIGAQWITSPETLF